MDNFPYNRAGRGQAVLPPTPKAPTAAFDEWGTPYDAQGNSLAEPSSLGVNALTALAAPVNIGLALMGSLSPYDGTEGGEGWRVPPIISEPAGAFARSGELTGFGEDGRFYLPNVRNPQAAQDVATQLLTLYGGNALSHAVKPVAPAGSVGMFAGRRAKTADLSALAKAEELAGSGATRDQIWNETGWFQGPDKQWRFEIDDSGAALTKPLQTVREQFGREAPLDMSFEHAKLFDAYPEARELTYYPTTDYGPGEASFGAASRAPGEFGPAGRIRVGYDEANPFASHMAAPSSTLHELQHYIQRVGEGDFARGGSPKTFAQDVRSAEEMISTVNQNMRAIVRQMDAAKASGDTSAIVELQKRYDDLMSYKLTDLVPRAQVDPVDQYRRLAGEVEARNVQTRMDMTPEQRRASPPWTTQDILDEDQIVRLLSDNRPSLMGSALASMQDNALPMDQAITGWHGSKHDFDKFSMDKIGTGTGFAWDGYGLNFSDYRPTAEAYRDMTDGAYLYQAELPSGPYLDYELPLNQHPPEVQAAITDLLSAQRDSPDFAAISDPSLPAGNHYGAIAWNGKLDHRKLNEELSKRGIVGRVVDNPDQIGSRNYTLFQEPTIAHKWRGDEQLYSDNRPSLMGSALASMQDNALPMDQASRLARAAEQGYSPLYHATQATQPFDAFEVGRQTFNADVMNNPQATNRHAVFASPDVGFANHFADDEMAVMPLMARLGNVFDATGGYGSLGNDFFSRHGLNQDFFSSLGGRDAWQAFDGPDGKAFADALKKDGYNAVKMQEELANGLTPEKVHSVIGGFFLERAGGNVREAVNLARAEMMFADPKHAKTYEKVIAELENPTKTKVADTFAILDPSNIRSVNAAFDPARAGENGLLLSDNTPSLLGSALASGQGGAAPASIRAYHGMDGPVVGDAFNGPSFWATDRPATASRYAEGLHRGQQFEATAPNVLPVDMTGKIYDATGLENKIGVFDVARKNAREAGADIIKHLGGNYEAINRGTVRSATTGETLFSDNRPSIFGSALASAQSEEDIIRLLGIR